MTKIVQVVLVDTDTGARLTIEQADGYTVPELAAFVAKLGGDE